MSHSQDPEKRIRIALSGAEVQGVEYVPTSLMDEVRVEVLQGHIDFRSDGGGLEPEIVWPLPKHEDPPRIARLNEAIDEYGEGRLEDMALDLSDPLRYLLVQSSPSDNEPWYVLCELIDDVLSYIRTEEDPWNFEALIDLDTGEEFDLVTDYFIKPIAKKETA